MSEEQPRRELGDDPLADGLPDEPEDGEQEDDED
jgi:hypothetical protein